MYDRDTVQALRGACLVALNAFVDQANKTRRSLDGIENVSVLSHGQLMQLLEQRIAEDKAFDRYQRARRALLAVARNSASLRLCSPDAA